MRCFYPVGLRASRIVASHLALAVAAVGLVGSGFAGAATIRDDTADNLYQAASTPAQYSSPSGYLVVDVGPGSGGGETLNAGSATLIAPGWVLTAAHLVTQDIAGTPKYATSQVGFGQGTTYTFPAPDSVSNIAVESGWDYDASQGNDLALVQLSSPLTSDTPAQLYTSSLGSELHQTATIIGYGTTGTGLTGNTGAYGTRRAITNVVDALGGETTDNVGGTKQYSFSNISSNQLITDFDQPGNLGASIMGSGTPTTLEGASAPGDSGGGLFLTVNGTTYLAGVTDTVGAFGTATTTLSGFYGNFNTYTRVSVSQSMSFIVSTLATSATWTASGGGNWSGSGNWASGNIPQFMGATANFGSAITSHSVVNVDDNWSVGTINFSNANSYTLSSTTGGSVTLNNTDLGANAAINVSSGSHAIDVPVTLTSSVNVAVTNSSSTLSMGGAVSGAGAVSLTGPGTLVLGSSDSYSGGTAVSSGTLVAGATGALPSGGAVNVSGGVVRLGTGAGLEQLSSLSINGSGKFDVNNDHIIINYVSGSDPIATIAAFLKDGYNNGAWNGDGIDSTAAQSNALYGVGYADSADTGNPAQLGTDEIEVKFTLLGDANLDGKVNGTDFAILAADFNQSVTGWDKGDFNYDGKVNGTDFTELAENFNEGANQASVDNAAIESFASSNDLSLGSVVSTSVPEPASAALVMLGFAGVMKRRRRIG